MLPNRFADYSPDIDLLLQVFLGGLVVIVVGLFKLWGFDKHIWDMFADSGVACRKAVFAGEALYMITSGLIKISILLFYRRMTRGSYTPVFHWAVRLAIVSVILYIIGFELSLFLGCQPLSAFWMLGDYVWKFENEAGVDYHCFDEGAMSIAAGVVSVVLDFVTCFLPMIVFWNLQCPTKQKFVMGLLFGVGFRYGHTSPPTF